MDNKDFIKIINEVFDFLNNSEIQKEEEILSLLNEEMFQKQFIVDSISYMGNKIKINNVDFNYEYKNDNDIQLGYSATLSYEYNDNELMFNIYIGTMNLYEIIMNKKSLITENIERFNINWAKIPVNLFTLNGDLIEFKAYKNESPEVKKEFIKAYIEDLVDNIDTTPIIDDEYNSPPIY